MAEPTTGVEVQVRRDDLTQLRRIEVELPGLAEGEVLARVERFALTANNVSYAMTGDSLGYWRFFPCEPPWGVIPVWGFARVLQSRNRDLHPGERVWGLLPMASHVVLQPGETGPAGFSDLAAHRQGLAEIYNRYQRTRADPPWLAGMDVARCALLPLFTTGFLVADFLQDNDVFGAREVIILSASSKTGLGLAHMLKRGGTPVRVTGVTSPANRRFVEGLGVYDTVLAYDEVERLDPSAPAVVVDMSGSVETLTRVHRRLGAQVRYSCIVGATHWRETGPRGDLPGAKPVFFFAPAQVAKREAEWGPGELLRRSQQAGLDIARALADRLRVEDVRGPDAAVAALGEMIAGRVPPSEILMLSL